TRRVVRVERQERPRLVVRRPRPQHTDRAGRHPWREPGRDCQRRRVPFGPRARARASPHARTAGVRRVHSARSGSSGSEIGSRSGFGVRVLAFSGSWFYRSAGQPEDQQPKNHGELETQNPEPRTRTPNPEPNPMPALIFRKGLDLKHAVAGMLADNYHSDIID